MKIKGILLGTAFISLFIGVFIILIGAGDKTYGVSDYTQGNLSTFNKINETYDKALASRNEISNSTSNPSITDKIGYFLGAGLDTVELAGSTVDITSSMIEDGSQAIPIEDNGIVKKTLSAVLMIGFVFAILYAILKVYT